MLNPCHCAASICVSMWRQRACLGGHVYLYALPGGGVSQEANHGRECTFMFWLCIFLLLGINPFSTLVFFVVVQGTFQTSWGFLRFRKSGFAQWTSILGSRKSSPGCRLDLKYRWSVPLFALAWWCLVSPFPVTDQRAAFQVSSSGTYSLVPVDMATATSQVIALRVDRGPSRDQYTLSFRKSFRLYVAVSQSLQIHRTFTRYRNLDTSALVNLQYSLHPQNPQDGLLRVGCTLEDRDANVFITPRVLNANLGQVYIHVGPPTSETKNLQLEVR